MNTKKIDIDVDEVKNDGDAGRFKQEFDSTNEEINTNHRPLFIALLVRLASFFNHLVYYFMSL